MGVDVTVDAPRGEGPAALPVALENMILGQLRAKTDWFANATYYNGYNRGYIRRGATVDKTMSRKVLKR